MIIKRFQFSMHMLISCCLDHVCDPERSVETDNDSSQTSDSADYSDSGDVGSFSLECQRPRRNRSARFKLCCVMDILMY